MNGEKVRELTANVNSMMQSYQHQQRCTAELFKICLEFLEDKQTGYAWGSGLRAAKEAAIRHKKRKEELVSAINDYIKMIEERKKSVHSQHESLCG